MAALTFIGREDVSERELFVIDAMRASDSISAPRNPASQLNARRAREAPQGAGLLVIPIDVLDPGQLETALAGLRDKGAQAIFVVADPRFTAQRRRIGELTTATGLPSICQERDYADAGCMVAYGANLRSMFRQAAVYV